MSVLSLLGSSDEDPCGSHDTGTATPSGFPPHRFRLFPVRSPLLGESRLLSLPRPTEMFHFGRFPPHRLCVQRRVTGHDPGRVSPFGHLRIKALSAAPRSFSQPDTSFIGSWRQGIHREPLVTWQIDARARYRVLKVRARSRPKPPPRDLADRGLAPSGPNSVPGRLGSRPTSPSTPA